MGNVRPPPSASPVVSQEHGRWFHRPLPMTNLVCVSCCLGMQHGRTPCGTPPRSHILGSHFCADVCETRRANTCLPVERVFPKATTTCLCSEVNGRLQTTQWGACSAWCSSLRAGHMIGVSHTDFD